LRDARPFAYSFDWKEGRFGRGNFRSQIQQRTGYYYKKITGKKLWQTSYYDHVLREEEDLIEVVNYIVSNPERSGLVKDYREYPWIGSQIYDVRALQ